MTSVRKSLLLSLADSYLGLVLQLASTVVLSRLLTPPQVGIFAIAAVFSTLASMFRDFGVCEYLIQERDLTPDKVRAALALNFMASWSMAMLMLVGSPLAASFYREPGVGQVMRVQAIYFLLVPFGAVTMARFRRDLNYAPIIISNALGSVVSFGTSILLAWLGMGYMSLAWSALAGIAVTVGCAIAYRPADMPRWPSMKRFREVFDFSKFAGAIYVVGQLGKGAPELAIGRVNGAADVGIFSRAGGLVEMFHRLMTRPAMSICMPYFAKADRESGTLVPAYLKSLTMLTGLGWPMLGCLGVMAYPAIRLVYGDQWLQAVPLAQVLCLACAVELTFLLSREALLACGQVRRANTLQLQIVGLQVLGISAVVPWGLPGASWGMVAAAAGGLACTQWHLQRGVGMRQGDMVRACAPSLVVTAASVLPLAAAAMFVPIGPGNHLMWAAWGAAYAAVASMFALRAIGHPLWREIVTFSARFTTRWRTSG